MKKLAKNKLVLEREMVRKLTGLPARQLAHVAGGRDEWSGDCSEDINVCPVSKG